MKVKILEINNSISKIKLGDIVKAKRLYDLTKEEMQESIGQIDVDDSLWEIDDIFIYEKGNYWSYVFDEEVEIVEE